MIQVIRSLYLFLFPINYAKLYLLGIYVHIPFCTQKCSYCNYAISTNSDLESVYFEALEVEIESRQERDGKEVDTIYFGGGTPSKASLQSLNRIIERLRTRYQIASKAEFTLEANPEDINAPNLSAWSDMGITRISLGLQSFQQRQLDWMKRAHDKTLGVEAIDLLNASSFEGAFSIDMIFGLPQQSLEDWEAEVRQVLNHDPGHLSTYGLEVVDGTALAVQVNRNQVESVDEDLKSKMYLLSHELLSNHGFTGYELASFAKSGKECRHNLHYWSHDEYLGFGLSAQSMLWTNDGVNRRSNPSDIKKYIEEPINFESLAVDGAELANEYLMVRLRTYAGLDLRYFLSKYGVNLMETHLELILSFAKLGLIEDAGNQCIRLSPEGRIQADQITAALMT